MKLVLISVFGARHQEDSVYSLQLHKEILESSSFKGYWIFVLEEYSEMEIVIVVAVPGTNIGTHILIYYENESSAGCVGGVGAVE